MLYLPELYYFFDQKDFPLEKAVSITAKKISEWCTHYKAQLIAPVKGLGKEEKSGLLPSTPQEKHQLIEDLLAWLISNSEVIGLFALFLGDKEIANKTKPAKFDHHDDTCCWVLDLTEQQFQELINAWKDNGLPEDLFYQQDHEIKIPKAPGVVGRLLLKLGITFDNSRYYSPKRWEAEKNKPTR